MDVAGSFEPEQAGWASASRLLLPDRALFPLSVMHGGQLARAHHSLRSRWWFSLTNLAERSGRPGCGRVTMEPQRGEPRWARVGAVSEIAGFF